MRGTRGRHETAADWASWTRMPLAALSVAAAARPEPLLPCLQSAAVALPPASHRSWARVGEWTDEQQCSCCARSPLDVVLCAGRCLFRAHRSLP
eukprot:6136596-Prymnesium_polylepis.1